MKSCYDRDAGKVFFKSKKGRCEKCGEEKEVIEYPTGEDYTVLLCEDCRTPATKDFEVPW